MTLAITLGQARTRVQQLLDDEDGARWSVGTGDFDASTEIDGALQMAISEAITTYVSQGGDRLDHVSDYSLSGGTTSVVQDVTRNPSSAPPSTIVTLTPLVITAVSLVNGKRNYPIVAIRGKDVEDTRSITGFTLRVNAVFSPDFTDLRSTDSLDYSPPNTTFDTSWPAMNEYVCSLAAAQLYPKEGESNEPLMQRIGMLQSAVIRRPESPMSTAFNSNSSRYSNYRSKIYRYSYITFDANAGQAFCLRLHKVGIGGII
jgi:hypothetical protein